MILTKEFLQAINACAEGYRFGLENNIMGLEYEQAIAQCLERGENDYALFLESSKNTLEAVMFSGIVESGDYVVIDPSDGARHRFENISDAQAKIEEIKTNFMLARVDCFAVNHVQQIEGGGEISTPVDLSTTEHADSFAVFNTFTGLYEPLQDKQAALARVQELKQQFWAANESAFRLWQEVKNSEGWTALKPVI